MSACLTIHPRETNLVVLPDLADGRVESLVDTEGLIGWCFHEDASQMFCQVMSLCVVGQFARTSQSGTLRDISQSNEREGGRGVYGHVTPLLTVNFHPPLVLKFALVSDEYHR
jgi:hypothetical protein